MYNSFNFILKIYIKLEKEKVYDFANLLTDIEEANLENHRAAEAHFAQMRSNIAAKREKWADRINSVINA